MMALSSEDEGASALFFANGRSATSTAYSTPTGSSLALVETKSELSAVHSDLELRLMQTFATYAGQQLVDSYLAVKNASRVTQLLGNTTEKLLTVTGVTAIVRFLFSQYQRVGGPLLGYVDEAMGRRIIDTVVSILLLAVEEDHKSAALALEAGGAIKLSREERVQALLRGEVPRLKALLDASYRQGYEEGVATVPEPVVMELKDFVPVEELVRVKDANREQVRELNHEMAALRASMSDLNKEKQRLEQRLIDVHNYRESERGQRFQEMEEELARTKLEANQKAHDLRRLELVVEAMRKKRKGKSSRSGKSTTSDEKNVSTA